MGMVASVEGADERDESDSRTGSGTGIPPSAPDRPWRHPSEVGLDVREQTDRRRGLGMAVAFVSVAGLVLLAATALTRLGSDSADSMDSEALPAVPAVAATVEVDTASGSRRAIAAIVEGGTHAMANATELGSLQGASITVSAGGNATEAQVVSTDSETEMVLLELDDAVTLSEPATVEPAIGESYQFTFLDHMAHLDTQEVAVESVGSLALRPNGTPASSVVVLDGWTDHQGPLTDADGHLAGWVFPAKGAHMAAYDAAAIKTLAHQMASSG